MFKPEKKKIKIIQLICRVLYGSTMKKKDTALKYYNIRRSGFESIILSLHFTT